MSPKEVMTSWMNSPGHKQNILMKNVMKIECKDGMVLLTDLLERQMALEGELLMANLVDGYAVVRERG